MGGRWSVCARNLWDKGWVVCDYNCNFLEFIFKGTYCLIKYEVADLGKHGG